MKKTTEYSIPVEKFKATHLAINDKKPDDLFGCMKGKIKSSGDLISPINIKWDVTRSTDCSHF